MFEMDGVELKFDEDALERVADLAIERKTRRQRSESHT